MLPATKTSTSSKRTSEKLTFLKSLAGSPRRTGAVAPSGPALSRLMASYVAPDDERSVLELGPGTGAVTAALIARGIQPKKIVAVEFNRDFCVLLRSRFAGATIIQGDAYDLASTLPADKAGPFSAVVSSLPLLAKPPEIRRRFVEEALARMEPGAPLVQFSYSPLPPVKPRRGQFTVEHSKWVILNLPPARVWIYRRAST